MYLPTVKYWLDLMNYLMQPCSRSWASTDSCWIRSFYVPMHVRDMHLHLISLLVWSMQSLAIASYVAPQWKMCAAVRKMCVLFVYVGRFANGIEIWLARCDCVNDWAVNKSVIVFCMWMWVCVASATVYPYLHEFELFVLNALHSSSSSLLLIVLKLERHLPAIEWHFTLKLLIKRVFILSCMTIENVSSTVVLTVSVSIHWF